MSAGPGSAQYGVCDVSTHSETQRAHLHPQKVALLPGERGYHAQSLYALQQIQECVPIGRGTGSGECWLPAVSAGGEGERGGSKMEGATEN